MSSLIFEVSEQRAIVATDTLLVSTGDLKPLAFMSKTFALPHLSTLMVCTGLAPFAWDWFFRLNGQFVTQSVETLNTHAPATLRQLWEGHKHFGVTSTIYHFIADAGRLRAFAFRSTANFDVEELPGECVGYKPPFEGHDAHQLNSIADIVVAMDKQRAEEATKPLDARVAIGGEMVVTILSANGHIEQWRAHRFADYDSQLEQMVDALRS